MNDYTILVNACDAYSDLWETFFYLLKINWQDSLHRKIIVNTETIHTGLDNSNVSFVNTKYDKRDRWGGRLLHCLRETDTKYVAVLMDDFFLRKEIDQDRIQLALDAMEEDSDIACFYMTDIFKEDVKDGKYQGFAEVPKWKNYRLNSAPAIWRKDSLIKYTKETDNPWTWEYFGSCRTNYTNDKFYAVSRLQEPICDYANAIYRGKWFGEQIFPLMKKYSLNIQLEKRGVADAADRLPRRSTMWKIQFVLTGISMVGFDAFRPLWNDIKKKYVSR